jgi:putative transposase
MLATMETMHPSQLDYQRDEHRVHLIVYHLIWCPKRRKPILTGTLKQRLEQLIEEKCQEKGWQIITLALQPDHLHLFVRVWPSDSAAEVVKELKGYSSFHLRQEFKPILSKMPSTWTRSYFASTAGAVSAQTIQRYIDAQKRV